MHPHLFTTATSLPTHSAQFAAELGLSAQFRPCTRACLALITTTQLTSLVTTLTILRQHQHQPAS
eukprot:124434-Amphidinium_carterae.2